MNFGNGFVVRGLALALCGLLLCAGTASALNRLYRYRLVKLSGVDESGSASEELGGNAPAKVYKDVATGIVYQIAQGAVLNEFGIARIFADRGLTLIDPTTGATLTATSDLEIVAKRDLRLSGIVLPIWRGSEIRTYDPRFATTTSN
jgi:hypothetical protein